MEPSVGTHLVNKLRPIFSRKNKPHIQYGNNDNTTYDIDVLYIFYCCVIRLHTQFVLWHVSFYTCIRPHILVPYRPSSKTRTQTHKYTCVSDITYDKKAKRTVFIGNDEYLFRSTELLYIRRDRDDDIVYFAAVGTTP